MKSKILFFLGVFFILSCYKRDRTPKFCLNYCTKSTVTKNIDFYNFYENKLRSIFYADSLYRYYEYDDNTKKIKIKSNNETIEYFRVEDTIFEYRNKKIYKKSIIEDNLIIKDDFYYKDTFDDSILYKYNNKVLYEIQYKNLLIKFEYDTFEFKDYERLELLYSNRYYDYDNSFILNDFFNLSEKFLALNRIYSINLRKDFDVQFQYQKDKFNKVTQKFITNKGYNDIDTIEYYYNCTY